MASDTGMAAGMAREVWAGKSVPTLLGGPARRRRPVGGPAWRRRPVGGLPGEGGWCLADYDAVLTEAGDYTTKYFALRNLFESILGTQLPFCWGAAPPREVVGGGRRGKGSPWAET